MHTIQLGTQDIENLIRIIDAAPIKGSEAEYVFKLRAHLQAALQPQGVSPTEVKKEAAAQPPKKNK